MSDSLKSIKLLSLALTLLILPAVTFSQYDETEFEAKDRAIGLEDWRRTEAYYQECLVIKELVIRGNYSTECYTNYHHFNSDSAKNYRPTDNIRWVEMSAFNLWHPGSKISGFKDNGIVAKMMNGYDIVAGIELLPSVGADYNHNQRVKKFLENAPVEIAKLEKRLLTSNLTRLKERLELYKKDLDAAKSLYRLPGYLALLDELRKLDPTWSLLLAPSGEAADEGFVQELVGFYYRGKTVKPKINEHCERFKKKRHGPSFGCYPKLTKAWFGKSVRQVFSRRPFMASFESGSFDFTLVTSHIIFRAAAEPAVMERVLGPSFGVSDYRDVGPGTNWNNFARVAEMKIILEIMEKVRMESNEKDIIFLGDTNLESKNEIWQQLLPNFPGGELFIEEETTLSTSYRLSNGRLTNGVASDYDHVIMDLNETSECRKSNGKLSARVANFLQGSLKDLIEKKYLIRNKVGFELNASQEYKRFNLLADLRKTLEARMTVKRNKVVPDDLGIEDTISDFDNRVFLSQLSEGTYYRVYREIISDHFPIYFSCSR